MHKIGNQGLEYSKENYTQYFVITYKEKKKKKNVQHIWSESLAIYVKHYKLTILQLKTKKAWQQEEEHIEINGYNLPLNIVFNLCAILFPYH